MWEENSKKHSAVASRSKLVNNSYDPTEDLHAWSIYRQNLNADLSECAIGVNKSTNSERPFGNFQLKETTVNNILNHPKYGPRLKNQDPYNYLRFGLPRAKAFLNNSSSPPNNQTNNNLNSKLILSHNNHSNHQRLNYLPSNKQEKNAQLKNSNSRNSISSLDDNLNTGEAIDLTEQANNSQRNLPSHSDNLSKKNNSKQGQVFSGRLLATNLSNEHSNRNEKKSIPNRKYLNNLQQSSSSHLNNQNNLNDNYLQSSPKNRTIDERDSSSTVNHLNYNQTTSQHHLTSSSNHRNPLKKNINHQNKPLNNHIGNSFLDNGPNPINVNQPKFPHLIVRNLYFELDKTSKSRRVCGAQRQKVRIIDNVSFEVRAGEMLAIMATNELEGSSILNVLANRHNKSRSRMKGDIIYNGVFLTPAKLSETLAYVSQDLELCPKMSTRQTILFATLLRTPARKKTFDTKKRIDAVLEELGLSEVRHTSVADLTGPEKRRLLIAINLMLDTDLLLLDQPTKEMDIFDTFFLIEYLRQWVVISGRCVILTIHPSTYEIFTMLSKVALISTGRTLYFGPRKDMLSYFSSIDFPCPAFKNPADYYLDLVTLDNLSTEAVLESSERIENLVDLYHRHGFQNLGFVPPAPSFISGSIKKQNFAIVFLALWIRSLIFTFPYNVIYMFRNVCLALCLSILTGSIFWHIRLGREQEFIWDRIMFYHCLLAIMPIPLFLIIISDVYKEKQYILNEIKMGFYGKGSYFVSSFVYSLPGSTLMLLAYALPASSMAAQKHNLIFYIAITLGYLHTIRFLALAMAWAFRKRSVAVIFFGIVYIFIVLTAGTSLHHKDLTIGIRLLQYATPFKWAHEALINWEFNVKDPLTRYLCSNNPIIQQENAILIKADCGFELKEHMLIWFNYLEKATTTSSYFIAFGLIALVFIFLNIISVCFFSRRKNCTKDINRQLLRSSYK